VDLRSYGALWYDSLDLPNLYGIKYMVEYVYLEFNASSTRIKCHCPVFDEYFIVNHDFVLRYGTIRALPPDSVLVDAAFTAKYPQVAPKPEHITALNIVLYIM
jgi:hypothetical protein